MRGRLSGLSDFGDYGKELIFIIFVRLQFKYYKKLGLSAIRMNL